MRRKARSSGGRQIEASVEGVGARGDGQSTLDGQALFLAQTLPGERVLAKVSSPHPFGYRGEVIELLEPSPERIDAPCPHFGPCGGCQLQHWRAENYQQWKRGLLVEALAKRGFDQAETLVKPLIALPAGTRRRALFAAERDEKGRVVVGFHRRASHAVEKLDSCLLLAPPLVKLLQPLSGLLELLLPHGEKSEATAIHYPQGIDLLLGFRRRPDLTGLQALAAFAQEQDLARLSLAIAREPVELLAERRRPAMTWGGVAVSPAPGAFLQPTPEGEKTLTDLVLAAIPKETELVADLFCGSGTFTFPLAQRGHQVHAVEGFAPALEALDAAKAASPYKDRITFEQRDLERDPVSAEELEGGGAVVFDPPRAGAKAEAAALAESDVPLVIAVSCNPSTFARDARTLVDGGYQMVEITPVDQFPWSGHLELVAVFRR